MKKAHFLYALFLFPILTNCQILNLDEYYGYYIGIASKDIKSQFQLKYYMLITLEKGFCGLNFNQTYGEKWVSVSDDIIAPKWDYQCHVSTVFDNLIQIQTNNFFFTLKLIDSLRFEIRNSTYVQYIGDTIYRVMAKRYKGDQIYNGWIYQPVYCPSLGKEMWRLNDNIVYPTKPVWYFFPSSIIMSDSLFNHPLTKKIRNKVKL